MTDASCASEGGREREGVSFFCFFFMCVYVVLLFVFVFVFYFLGFF